MWPLRPMRGVGQGKIGELMIVVIMIPIMVVVMLIPIVLRVPFLGIFVPPAVVMIPAIRASSIEFRAPMIGFRASPAVVLDRFM